jgi:plasmid stability protein
MKNITVSVDDDVYRRARVRAAEEGRSVSAVVRDYLRAWLGEETHFERLEREEFELRARLMAEGRGLCGRERLSREEVHERRRGSPSLPEAAE